MARVQLIIPDADHDRFADQAQREGMSLSAWLRTAARERLEAWQQVRRFESPEDIREFFRACDDMEGPKSEPDWNEHLQVINKSRAGGTTHT